jgi:cysteine desulfurase / selenocysteine lyase
MAAHTDPKAPDPHGLPFTDDEVQRIRRDFPVLRVEKAGRPIVYLDNAATSQKPRCVIERVRDFYENENANIHRGVHFLSQRSTDAYEEARKAAARFLGAELACEIIFTRGTTEGINLVAQTFGRQHVGPGDEILLTTMEHHSNIVPWQMLCEETGARLRVAPINDEGELILDAFERLLTKKTKLAALNHASNALGTVNPVKTLVDMAHSHGVPVLLDGAQSVPHLPVDVEALGCDFFVCSGHKMFGPTGVGILYGRAAHLEAMPPYQGGGDMILSVTFEKTVYNTLPHKFEAGTPHIAGAIGLAEAIAYVERIGMDRVRAHEDELLRHGTGVLSGIDGVRLIGTARDKVGVLSFVVDSVHPHDVGQVLDDSNIAIRVGHHCAQPVMDRFGIPGTARASLAFYNTKAELDALGEAILELKGMFD